MTFQNKALHTLNELAEITEGFLCQSRAASIFQLRPALMAYQGIDWRPYVTYDSECYTRNYVVRKRTFEILVLCWQPGQGSPIHNHAHQGCLLKVLQGSLTETRFCQNQIKESQLSKGDISYIDDQIGLHQIKNNGRLVAISLHIYAPGYFIPKTGNCMEDF